MKLILAPMAEITTPALRETITQFPSSVILTSEMLSAGALLSGKKHNESLLANYTPEIPLIYQIVGDDPQKMAAATSLLSGRTCHGIDINMGCPAPDIIKRGWGSKLIESPQKAKEIVSACRKIYKGKLSVKTRIGFENDEKKAFINFIKMLEGEGIDEITIHPRHAKLYLSRTAKWDYIKLAVENLSIPVIGNGDITTPEQAIAKQKLTNCHGIMIGRESIKSPWIFNAIDKLEQDKNYNFVVNVEKIFINMLEKTRDYLPESLHKSRKKRFSAYFSKNVLFSHQLYIQIAKSETIDDAINLIIEYFTRNPNERVKTINSK